MESPGLPPNPPSSFEPAAVSRPVSIHSRALFDRADLVMSHHAGTHYRLRLTRLNKLILSK